MNTKKSLSLIGLWIIALVVSMPFYAADAYAVSVSITKNEGSAGIEGFIDAEGDTWTVEATVSGWEEVAPEKIKIKVGDNEAEFDSCSETAMGAACEYVSPLDDGVAEGGYAFDVLFYYLGEFGAETKAGDSDTITADGSGPKITFNGKGVWQSEGKLKMDFLVEDRPAGVSCAGLEKVEVIDSSGGEALWSFNDFEGRDCDFNFADVVADLAANLEGEGRRVIKVRAVDRLGHETVEGKSFESDFEAPLIKEDIAFASLGEFIGNYEIETDIAINVTERGDEVTVKGYSEQADLEGEEAVCELSEAVDDLWNCRWESVKIVPAEQVELRVEATDKFGNKAEKTLAKHFAVDSSPPEIVFFGTDKVFEGVSYVSGVGGVKNKVILKVKDSGAGMSAEGVRANLAGLGGEAFATPECEQGEETFDCEWEADYAGSGKDILIGLSYFKDKAGNEGTKPEIKLQVDSAGPKVGKIELYGLSEAGKKNYLQSGDSLVIDLEAVESSGLLVMVNLNNLVTDAGTKFPENELTKGLSPASGWQVFTEDNCAKEEGRWSCSLETEALKSGYFSALGLTLKVLDTAGNEAVWTAADNKGMPKNKKSGSEGAYKVELLGVETEEEPDYWEVNYAKPAGGEEDFVDMDTTELIPTRIAMKISLRTETGAEAAKIDLVDCTPEEGFSYQQREVLFENLAEGASADPRPVLILEFAPFSSREYFKVGAGTFEKGELEYKCRLNIYSQVGRKALKNAEQQEVALKIPFAFTSLGAIDENLDDRVKEAKSGYYEATEWIGVLGTIFEWLDYAAKLVGIVVTVGQIVTIFDEKQVIFAEAAEDTGVLAEIGAFLRGSCFTLEGWQSGSWEFVKYLQIPTGILSCSPESGEGIVGGTWYGWWQRSVLEAYNIGTGRGMLGIPAGSLYDNFYLSILGLCVPGIVYNLKQLREIHCRRIVCLQREVPQGIATVEACDQLYDLLECEFFTGPAYALIPGLGIPNMIADAFKAVLSSPLGLISLFDIGICGAFCFTKGTPGLLTSCKAVRFITKSLDIIETIVGAVYQRPDVTGSPYCGMVDEELAGKPAAEEEEPE